MNCKVILKHIATLFAIGFLVILAVGSTDSNGWDGSRSPTYRQAQSRKWYEGGTLHNKSALQWQVAKADDKLATCSDFVAAMWKEKNFVPRIQNSINSVDSMKPYAQELVKFLDAATKKHDDPVQNRQMYANQTVSSMATIGMVSMGWLK